MIASLPFDAAIKSGMMEWTAKGLQRVACESDDQGILG